MGPRTRPGRSLLVLALEKMAVITRLFAAPFVCLFECMVRLHLAATFPSIRRLHRSGFDCEILLIANCEFFHNSQSKESQEKDYSINNIARLAIRNH